MWPQSLQNNIAELSPQWQMHQQVYSHATGGRRRKYKGPAAQASAQATLPDLPRRPDDSDVSRGCEAEKEAKRPRSTSTTPKSVRGLEPYEYDRLMGVPSVGSTSGEERVGEATDPENPNTGVADDFAQRPDSSSVAVEGSRGIGSASSLEVLNRNRI